MATTKPKAGSRLAQSRVDSAERGYEAKRKALKRTVRDKSTGALVYPLKGLQEYSKAEAAWANARVDNLSPARLSKIRAGRPAKKGK